MATIEYTTYPVAHRVDGVRRKRVVAFLIDFTIVTLLWLVACVIVGVLGVLTLGLAWLLYGAVFPVVAVLYSGISIANRGATPGMRTAGLAFRMQNGERPGFIQGAVHVVLFYASVTFLTPLVLIVGFLNSRKRFLHDMVIGATVENA